MVSAPVRQAALLAILLVVVIVRAQQPGPMLAFGGDPDGFPRSVVAKASPTPNVYADRPEVRVLQLIDSMNAMWATAFADAGATYEKPRIRTRAREAGEGCGGKVGGWAGIYCRDDESITIDLGDHLVGRAAVGDDGADLLLGYVLAHEVGHHVQSLRGFGASVDDILPAELHAQCLAGVWAKAAGRPVRPPWSYGVDADHGTLGQQRFWLERGYASGRPADCDGVWADGGVDRSL
jgi:predicted metalloprotease